MVILVVLSPVAQDADGTIVLRIVGDDNPSFPISPEILGWIETKTSQIAESSDALTLVLGPVCLRGIFDDDESMAASDVHNRVHICWLAVEVNG